MAYKPKERTNILIPLAFKSRVLKWSNDRVGKLVKAAFNYVLFGEWPDFSDDETLSDTFDEYVEKLDEDGFKWNKKILSSQFPRWCEHLEKSGKNYLKVDCDEYVELHREYDAIPQKSRPPFDDWLSHKRDITIQYLPTEDSITDFDNNDVVLPWEK